MQTNAETASKAVAAAEAALRAVVEQKQPDIAGFEPILEKLRWTSQDYFLLVFPGTAAKTSEDKLWENHLKVHKKFQKHLKQFRDGPGKKKHVERRKAEKHYLAFIKASIKFYRGFIGRLASHFKNVPEISLIATKLHLESLSVDSSVATNVDEKKILIQSCYAALMRLGDLSRYRETELQTKERNWGPAKGHYQLAIFLHPESGAAFNQLAVMALADDDHLRAVYYLHRAAAAGKPFPVAPANLRLEFEKVLKMKPQETSAVLDMSKDTLNVLETRLLEFHANCHTRPGEFLTYQEKSSQILQLVQLGFEEVKDHSLDKIMQKMCLINIAAEFLAWRGTSQENLTMIGVSHADLPEEHQRNCQAFFLLQRFNFETFLALLKILARELDTTLTARQEGAKNDEQEHATTAIRRLLPHLRQYSSWLLSNIKVLLKPKHASTRKCAEKFWKCYIQVLNMLLKVYQVRNIPETRHLLEEDEATLAFAPFSEKVNAWRYKAESGEFKKPLSPILLSQRPVEDETCFRAREMVVDALRLSNAKAELEIEWSPIVLGDSGFEYQEQTDAPPPETVKTPSQPFRIRANLHTKSASENLGDAVKTNGALSNGIDDKPQSVQPAQQAHPATDVAMEIMVDDLVNPASNVVSGPQPTASTFNSSSLISGSPRPQVNAISVTDLVGRMLQRPASSHSQQDSTAKHSSNPALAGIFASPFTPRPEEKASLSPRMHTVFPTGSPTASAHRFSNDFLQQDSEMQARTSPLQRHFFAGSMPSQTTHNLGFAQPGPSLSQSWGSPTTRSPSQQYRQLPQAALFGAIGDSRRSGSRTPLSGQSG